MGTLQVVNFISYIHTVIAIIADQVSGIFSTEQYTEDPSTDKDYKLLAIVTISNFGIISSSCYYLLHMYSCHHCSFILTCASCITLAIVSSLCYQVYCITYHSNSPLFCNLPVFAYLTNTCTQLILSKLLAR